MSEKRFIDVAPLRQQWLEATNAAIYEPNDVLDSIDEQPDAEVVEVVKCENCVYSYKIDAVSTLYDCRNHRQSLRAWNAPGDFCSHGRPKE